MRDLIATGSKQLFRHTEASASHIREGYCDVPRLDAHPDLRKRSTAANISQSNALICENLQRY